MKVILLSTTIGKTLQVSPCKGWPWWLEMKGIVIPSGYKICWDGKWILKPLISNAKSIVYDGLGHDRIPGLIPADSIFYATMDPIFLEFLPIYTMLFYPVMDHFISFPSDRSSMFFVGEYLADPILGLQIVHHLYGLAIADFYPPLEWRKMLV